MPLAAVRFKLSASIWKMINQRGIPNTVYAIQISFPIVVCGTLCPYPANKNSRYFLNKTIKFLYLYA